MQHRHGKFRVVGFGWLQPAPGVWERWMLRQCSHCSSIDPMAIHYVDAEYDMCPSCLSQQLAPLDENPKIMVCAHCKMQSPAGSQLDDEPDHLPGSEGFDDEDDDDDSEPWKS